MTDASNAINIDKSTIRRFFGYLQGYRAYFVIAIIGMIGYSAVDAFVIAQLQPIIDDSLGQGNYDFLRLAAFLVVPMFILRGIFNFMGTYTLNWISGKVVMRLRQHLFNHYMAVPVSFHDKYANGELISRLTFDTEQVANAAGKALLILVREGALVLGLLFVMFYYSWQLSLIFLLVGPIVTLIVAVVSKRFRRVSRNIQHAMGNLTTAVEQIIKAHKVVIMHGKQVDEAAIFHAKNNHNRQQNMKLAVAQILSVSSIQVIASVALAFVMFLASSPGLVEALTPGVFTNVVVCMTMLLKPLKQLTTINNQLQRGLTACDSIFRLLDELEEVNTGQTNPTLTGQVSLRKVSFTYDQQLTPALSEIDLDINAGQTIALVGRSGSGKSTLASLLTRFYQHQQGTIEFDGIPIEQIELNHLRQQIAVVSQHITLFDDTIANNICYGVTDVDEQTLAQAIKMAHVDEFTDDLPDGLQTMVGEDGVLLSGGQRQRIAIARALVRQTPFIIFDEATSALDSNSEASIQQALLSLQARCTCILIAHRLSTIEHADHIVVLENGSVLEHGSHSQLLSQQGMYWQLYSLQHQESE